MLRYLLLVSALFSFHWIHSQTNDWTDMGLHGKVRTITEITYKASGTRKKLEKEYIGEHTIYKFNQLGYLTETIHLEPVEGNVDSREIFTYDSFNKLLSIKTCNKDSIIYRTHIFFYNETGQKIKDSVCSDELCSQYVYLYNEKGYCTELSGYLPDGRFFTKYVYEYDSLGNQTKLNWYKQDGEIIHSYLFKYDETGKLVEELCIYYTDIGMKVKTIYVYDSKGNLIEKKDNYGQEVYTNEGFNWIKKIIYEKNKPSSVTERTIEYFR